VKRLLKKISSSPYRTYTRSGISSVNIIDYRFKDMDIETQKALAQLDRKLDKLPEL